MLHYHEVFIYPTNAQLDCSEKMLKILLTLIQLTWRIWWAPHDASKWQMGFNLAFRGL